MNFSGALGTRRSHRSWQEPSELVRAIGARRSHRRLAALSGAQSELIGAIGARQSSTEPLVRGESRRSSMKAGRAKRILQKTAELDIKIGAWLSHWFSVKPYVFGRTRRCHRSSVKLTGAFRARWNLAELGCGHFAVTASIFPIVIKSYISQLGQKSQNFDD